MAKHKTLKRKLAWVEAGLYVAGAVLVAVFVYLRVDAERMRAEGMASFERTLSEAVQAGSTQQDGVAARLPDDASRSALAPAPNQQLWDERRIRAFQAARAAGQDSPLAVLRIDHLGVVVPVYDGTEELTLNRGAGRIRGTARVGADGNLGIAAHRDSFFRPLKDIKLGDTMELKTAGGTVTYAVSSIEIVEPDDVSVLDPTDGKTLTLVTCYPFYYVGHAPKRFIVKATAEHPLAKRKVREL